MNWDNVYSWSQALAVFFAAVALVSGFVVNKRQARENRAQAVKIAELGQSTSELKEKNIAAQRDLEKEKAKRLEMEKSINRRSVAVVGDSGKTNAEPLKEFAGKEIEILFTPDDSDARRAAQYLSFTLGNMGFGWHVVSIRPDRSADEIAGDGVEIESFSSIDVRNPGGPSPSMKDLSKRQRAETLDRIAANTLASFLASEPNNWERVRCSRDVFGGLPPNRLRIKIGLRPMRYFQAIGLPAWVNEKSPEEERKEEEQRRAEEIQRDRESLKHMDEMEEWTKQLQDKGIIAPEEN